MVSVVFSNKMPSPGPNLKRQVPPISAPSPALSPRCRSQSRAMTTRATVLSRYVTPGVSETPLSRRVARLEEAQKDLFRLNATFPWAAAQYLKNWLESISVNGHKILIYNSVDSQRRLELFLSRKQTAKPRHSNVRRLKTIEKGGWF